MRTASQVQGACRGRGGRYGQEALSEEGPRGLSLWQPADPGEDLSVQAEWEAWPEEEALQGMGMRLETRRGPWGLMTRASSRVPEPDPFSRSETRPSRGRGRHVCRAELPPSGGSRVPGPV